MSGYMLAAQELIFTTLDGNISANVYDDVPNLDPGIPDHLMPFVVIGNDQSDEYDTDTWTGENLTIELHIWDRYDGNKTVKEIMKEIYDLLHRQPLTKSGYVVNDCLHTFSAIPNVGASNYVHGICRYRLTLTEAL